MRTTTIAGMASTVRVSCSTTKVDMHKAISGHFGGAWCTGMFGQQSMPSVIIGHALPCAERAAVNGVTNSPAIKQAARRRRMA